MKLTEFIRRAIPPDSWAEGENIPWDEPGFSRRMLDEHLDPAHNAASRRPQLIDEQVDWLHHEILDEKPTRILDLGCGPGLYTARLARLGHRVTGVDISPASLEYAHEQSAETGAECEFIEGDFRTTELVGTFGLVMQIYGELNVFRRTQAAEIISKCAAVLEPGGRIVLEVDKPGSTRRHGESPPNWRSRESGLFSDRPHLYLEESYWDEQQRVATKRYWIIDGQSAEVTRFAQSFAAYEPAEYRALLTDAGFTGVELIDEYPGCGSGKDPEGEDERWMLVGRKQS